MTQRASECRTRPIFLDFLVLVATPIFASHISASGIGKDIATYHASILLCLKRLRLAILSYFHAPVDRMMVATSAGSARIACSALMDPQRTIVTAFPAAAIDRAAASFVCA
jgi:hypothetical protein